MIIVIQLKRDIIVSRLLTWFIQAVPPFLDLSELSVVEASHSREKLFESGEK